MDALIEVPMTEASAKVIEPAVVASVVVPNYIPRLFDQGVVVRVLTVNGTSISAFNEAYDNCDSGPRLTSRGLSYALSLPGGRA